jgi:penicillin-binding protein 1A
VPDEHEQVIDERYAYQMVSMLEGVVQRGTAARLAKLNRPLAGKTGTTNENRDTWFIGFTPDLVIGVFVGFDEPKPLGAKETGASSAVPAFEYFVTEALKDQPPVPFRVPSGVRMVRVDIEGAGEGKEKSEKKTIWEAFIPGTEPGEAGAAPILNDGSGFQDQQAGTQQPVPEGQYNYNNYNPLVTTPPPPSGPAGELSGTGGLY